MARYAGPVFTDEAVALAAAPDGSRVFVTGWSIGDPDRFKSDIVTIAYDAITGAELWIDRFDGPGGGWDHPNDVAVSPSGETVFVLGGAKGTVTGRDYVLIAYDSASGGRRWVFTYDGPSERRSLDSGQGIAIAPDGDVVFVTGYSADGLTASGSYNTDYATVAIDAVTGQSLWTARHDGAGRGRDYAFEAGVAGQGAVVVVTGWNAGHGERSNDAVTIGYETDTGAELWIARYDGPGGTSDATYDLAISPDETQVFVAGNSFADDAGRSSTLLVAYDALTGQESWNTRYERGPRSTEASDVVVSPDGATVFTAGFRSGRGTFPCYRYDYLTLAFDTASGDVRWSATYDGSAGCADYALAAVAAADAVFVTGLSKALGTHQDAATVAYGVASGAELWVARYDGPAGRWDAGNDLAAASDGGVYVVGESNGTGSYRDFVTIRYES